jgi:hypothetical protein
MTNAEKYKEVFGMPVDTSMCPTDDCKLCPCVAQNQMGDISCLASYTFEWWNKEYKGGAEE